MERKADVAHRFVMVNHDGKVARLVSELSEPERGLTLVFVRTKRGADRLVKKLASSSVQAVAMHGDKSQGQRERALANFEAGVIDTLVATDVAARGIDVAGITHVINYDIPATREDYVHRIGRTARAGASGVGVTLVAHDQARELAGMVGELGLDRELAIAGIGARRPQRGAVSGSGSGTGPRAGDGRTNGTRGGRANGNGAGRANGNGAGRANGNGAGRANGNGAGRANGNGAGRANGNGAGSANGSARGSRRRRQASRAR